jgi:exodeoxyribonuclease VII large subunit
MSIQANFTPTIPEYTVSEISTRIKNTIELEFGYVRIRGEISGLKIATSGHGYMNLKDNDAVLSATCWKPTLAKLAFALEEGMEVIASGKLTTYSGQSRYQLSIDKIEPAGSGALMQMLIQRKVKLEKEGLFDKQRKKKLPFFPKKIGIVTSLTGAVIKDMLHRIKDRCPVHVVIWPCVVQGENCAQEVSNAIAGFNKLDAASKPDIIIVARGGGSIEDLWAFNEEIVVRAVADSDIPIISAIGHETDFTLVDFAADVRAPTPTAAAEFAVPVLVDLKYIISQHFNRMRDILWQIISHKTKIIRLCDNIVSNPMRLVRHKEQNLDYLGFKLFDKLPQLIHTKNMRLDSLSSKITDPSKMLKMKQMQINHSSSRLTELGSRIITQKLNSLNLQTQLLQTLDYKNVLKRGFAMIESGGKVITSSENLYSKNKVTITMHDGKIDAVIE